MKKSISMFVMIFMIMKMSSQVKVVSGGNVGIGTNSPTAKLHVTGTSRFSGPNDLLIDFSSGYYNGQVTLFPSNDWWMELGTSTKYIGDIFVQHVTTRQAVTVTSDKNMKQNINYKYEDVMAKIRALKPAMYNFKPELFGNAPEEVKSKLCSVKQHGMIAQDLLMVFPELVDKDEKTGLLGVNYTGLIPVLISGMQEQDKQISDLKNQLNSCCSKNSTLINNNVSDNNIKPLRSYLAQNNPNPYKNETTIKYSINEEVNSSSSILFFDMSGKLLKSIAVDKTGEGAIIINGRDFVPGMYYYTLIVNGKEIDTKKMILTE